MVAELGLNVVKLYFFLHTPRYRRSNSTCFRQLHENLPTYPFYEPTRFDASGPRFVAQKPAIVALPHKSYPIRLSIKHTTPHCNNNQRNNQNVRSNHGISASWRTFDTRHLRESLPGRWRGTIQRLDVSVGRRTYDTGEGTCHFGFQCRPKSRSPPTQNILDFSGTKAPSQEEAPPQPSEEDNRTSRKLCPIQLQRVVWEGKRELQCNR